LKMAVNRLRGGFEVAAPAVRVFRPVTELESAAETLSPVSLNGMLEKRSTQRLFHTKLISLSMTDQEKIQLERSNSLLRG
jgi:hypothetical protein